jgi:hypothetical protein
MKPAPAQFLGLDGSSPTPSSRMVPKLCLLCQPTHQLQRHLRCELLGRCPLQAIRSPRAQQAVRLGRAVRLYLVHFTPTGM